MTRLDGRRCVGVLAPADEPLTINPALTGAIDAQARAAGLAAGRPILAGANITTLPRRHRARPRAASQVQR
jgi:hypothetical protein